MINEKKLIEALLHNDGMNFTVNLHDFTPEGVCTFLMEFTKNMKRGFINLIKAQPKEECWINPTEQPPNFFESVLIHVPGEHPFPTVHEGYLTPEKVWKSPYGESYTMDEVPFWKPMPKPPEAGGGA